MIKLAVYIGRFQPFHRGHMSVVEAAATHADETLILVGSAGEPRTLKNPWTADERISMIENAIVHEHGVEQLDFVFLAQLQDHHDDRRWAHAVRNAVMLHMISRGYQEAEITLIGHSKDHTSYYLRMFPDWRSIEVPNFEGLSATPIREGYFFSRSTLGIDEIVTTTANWLNDWASNNPKIYYDMRAELSAQDGFRAAWDDTPYKPVFITADALVERSGHIILIRRGRAPYKGLEAIPGGFLKPTGSLLQTAIEELTEETGDAFTPDFLRSHLREVRTFDAPGRDPRGRFVTHVHHFVLPDDDLPPLVAGDDADAAGWVPIAAIDRSRLAFDHHHILTSMVKER